jgi:hypothetical protein
VPPTGDQEAADPGVLVLIRRAGAARPVQRRHQEVISPLTFVRDMAA